MTALPFDHWVNDNNPPPHLEYGKGWWDYIVTLQRLAGKFEIDHVDVVGTYVMETPPPREELLMPVVRFRTATVELVVKYDFGTFPEVWTVSTKITKGHIPSTFGLFDGGLRLETVAGFDAAWIYPPYSESPDRFSCQLADEWDLAAFTRLALWAGSGNLVSARDVGRKSRT